MKRVRIGTRASKLAVIQAEIVAEGIRRYTPEIDIELVPMKTTGDIILNQTLDKIGGKGLFVKELDRALLEDKVDITVHSCKDLPMDLDPRLPLVAVSQREDARDALILPQGIQELDYSKPVGCSSSRRRLQIQALYPGVPVQPVRGNVLTRLEKLDNGQFSALILAISGLKRLQMEERVNLLFSTEQMLPAAGQGVLAVQARAGEETSYLAGIEDAQSMACVLAERAFVRALDGGCSKPCAAYAYIQEDGQMLLRGMYVSDDESCVRYGTVNCAVTEAEQEASRLAERLRVECKEAK